MRKVNVLGYENIYSIDDSGIVYSHKLNAPLKTDNSSGYKRIILQKNKEKERVLVHRLVAKHFVDGYYDGAIVNHKDGNTLNNNFDNLEWCNQSHNLKHSVNITKTRDMAIKKKQTNNKSGYIGVRKQDDVYCVQIRYKNKTIFTRYGFKTAKEAAKCRDEYLYDNNLPHTRSL